MKKIILSIVALVAFAAVSQAQFKVGFKAGATLDNPKVNATQGNIYGSERFEGFHAGLIGDLSLGHNFYLQPQLLYARKGTTLLSSTGTHDMQVRINAVEIPVNLLYKFDVPFGKVFAGTGATFSYAVTGKQTINGATTSMYKNNNWRREDINLNFTAGLEFNNGMFASVNSQKGLLNTSRNNAYAVKSSTMSVSVGYLIDWNKLRKKG